MEPTSIAQEIAALPPEAQKQVADLAFLKTRYPTWLATRKTRRI